MGTGFINHRSVHFSPRCKYFSSKCNSHSTECFAAIQPLLLMERIHCLFNSTFFRGKINFSICFFHYCHNQKYTSELHIFINHFLKDKRVFLAEFLQRICKRFNFSEVTGLQACNLTINTFTGTFQGFCLVLTNSHLKNTSQ